MALVALRELYGQHFSVPAEISVTGYDNINLSEFCCPSLTTLYVPREKIGHLIWEALVQESDNSSIRGLELHIEPELVIRESTGPVRRK
jgi:LacI family transcriptional regulator, galactose operon repressor